MKEPLASTVYPELYHYTTITALQGILNSNTLWATRATHLNDSSEMTILWPVLEEKCVVYLRQFADEYLRHFPEDRDKFEALGGASRVADKDGRMIINVMRELLFGNVSKAGMGLPFVVSFTTHDEEYHRQHGMLSQWRGYGQDDSVAIVFDTKTLEHLLKREAERFELLTCSIADVIYCHEDVDLVGHFPSLFCSLKQFAQNIFGGWNDCDKENQNILASLSSALLPAVGRLKHRAFGEEKECRIILGIPDESFRDQLEELGRRDLRMKKVHYRAGIVGSIPYVKLFEDTAERLEITRILVGPSRNQRANEQAVYEAVNAHGMEGAIRIQCSEMPFVGSV